MDPSNGTLSEADIQAIIEETYVSFVYNIVVISVIALLLYTTLLQIPQEIEHVWTRRFSLPSLLYVLARYPVIVTQIIYFAIGLLPSDTTPERTCNILYNVASSFAILTFIGVQGLLIARAYALCRGGKVVAVLLAFTFFTAGLFLLLEVILFDTCTFNGVPTSERVIDLLGNITSILIDVVSFCLCLYKVWDTWKSKRGLNVQGGNDLASIFFKQIISRFCFTILISVTYAIIGQFLADTTITSSLSSIQAGFSVILISDFTLALREDNSTSIDTNNATLPAIRSVNNVLQHIHQTFLIELGDEEDMDSMSGSDGSVSSSVDLPRNHSDSDTLV